MSNEKEGLKLIGAEIINFKGIRNKTININGRSFKIYGKNGAFKSSLIQAILSPLDSKSVPSEPITQGEEKASIKLKIAGTVHGDYQEYELKMNFTHKNKKGTIKLYDGKGVEQKTSKGLIDSIFSFVAFDIFQFMKDNRKKQIQWLKEISGCGEVIDKLDAERKDVFEKRAKLNAVVDNDEAIMKNHGFSQSDIDDYENPISEEDMLKLQENVDNISKEIESYNRIKNGTADYLKKSSDCQIDFTKCDEEIGKSNKEIERLKSLITVEEDKIKKKGEEKVALTTTQKEYLKKNKAGQEWLSKNTEPNAKSASEALKNAVLHNSKHKEIKALADRNKKLLTDKDTVLDYTEQIAKIDDKKTITIKNSKLPVEGLTFTDDNIFYNGLPFEEEQINTATFYKIAQKISMALNPNLKVLFWNSASLLDPDTQAEMMKEANDAGYMVIAEVVSSNPDVEIVFTEEEE